MVLGMFGLFFLRNTIPFPLVSQSAVAPFPYENPFAVQESDGILEVWSFLGEARSSAGLSHAWPDQRED